MPLPDFVSPQTGRTAVVTGANSGIGFRTAHVLAQAGAHVVLGCRSEERGAEAAKVIQADSPAGSVEVLRLDLADLDSVGVFATELRDRYPKIELLVANAAVMMPPQYEETVDGFELQMGTNHLGHFALTGLLIDRLLATPRSRVVVVSSLSEHYRSIDLGDLHSRRGRYPKYAAYARSKLANLLFAFELARRVEAVGAELRVIAAHVGISDTKLQRHSPLTSFFFGAIGMRPAQGALPVLYAATAEAAEHGAYYGPSAWWGLRGRGRPRPAWASRRSRDPHLARHLWELSSELTGVRFDALDGPPAL